MCSLMDMEEGPSRAQHIASRGELSVQLLSLSKRWESLSYHFYCCSLIFPRALNSQAMCTKYFSPQNEMDILQDSSGGTQGLKFTQKCGHLYGNTNITKVRHYKTKLQLVGASRRNIAICCQEKIFIYKIMGWKNRELNNSIESESFHLHPKNWTLVSILQKQENIGNSVFF